MAKVGAQRAAELTGKSKSTIQRAMNSGKLSYELDPNGRRVIDVSELERCFGLQQGGNGAGEQGISNTVQQELEKAQALLETERLKMRIRMLEEQLDTATSQIDDLKAQRDSWQKQASQVLITSQYSQKQAEDLAQKLKEREQRARERREQREKPQQKRVEQNMRPLQNADNENQQDTDSEEKFNFNGLWKKVKGQN